jgi:DNA-binding MarR family transcriptional regulator
MAEAVSKLAPDDEVLREFIADFSAASALMRRLRHTLSESLGLSSAEHSVMLGLWYCERRGETTVRTLADHLHVAAAHVTATLGKLEVAGLVLKRSSVVDRRAVNIQLSKKGHELLDRLAPVLREVNVPLFAGVHYSDMVVVHRFFRRVIKQAPEAIGVAELRNAKAARDEGEA